MVINVGIILKLLMSNEIFPEYRRTISRRQALEVTEQNLVSVEPEKAAVYSN